jgi:hypothetical protein
MPSTAALPTTTPTSAAAAANPADPFLTPNRGLATGCNPELFERPGATVFSVLSAFWVLHRRAQCSDLDVDRGVRRGQRAKFVGFGIVEIVADCCRDQLCSPIG